MTADHTWVRTATLTTVTLCQAPGAPELGEGDVDEWLAANAVAAITAEPPCPLEAAATVVPVPEADRTQAEALAARQHLAGVPGRDAADGVSTWRHVVVQLVFPPGAAEIEVLVTHAHRALASLRPPSRWRATLEAATFPLPAAALPAFEQRAGAWTRSSGL